MPPLVPVLSLFFIMLLIRPIQRMYIIDYNIDFKTKRRIGSDSVEMEAYWGFRVDGDGTIPVSVRTEKSD